MSTAMSASHRAARVMSLFVAAFFIQWWSMVVYGIWDLAAGTVPQPVVHCVTTFTNIGGILNLGVFLLVRRDQSHEDKKVKGEMLPRTNATLEDSQDL